MFLAKLGIEVAAVYVPGPVARRREAPQRRAEGARCHGHPHRPLSVRVSPGPARAREERVRRDPGRPRRLGHGLLDAVLRKDASFPFGPFRIAQASGAPIFPVFVLQDEDGRYRTIVEEPIRVPQARGEAAHAAVLAGLATFVARMEATIRAYPTQWYRFARFWESEE